MEDKVKSLIASLEQEVEQHKANVYRCMGAIQALKQLLEIKPEDPPKE